MFEDGLFVGSTRFYGDQYLNTRVREIYTRITEPLYKYSAIKLYGAILVVSGANSYSSLSGPTRLIVAVKKNSIILASFLKL